MLGFADLGVTAAYLCTIGSAVLCVVYGLFNWNKPVNHEAAEIEEEIKWEKREPAE
jgi:hypothetical protein